MKRCAVVTCFQSGNRPRTIETLALTRHLKTARSLHVNSQQGFGQVKYGLKTAVLVRGGTAIFAVSFLRDYVPQRQIVIESSRPRF